MDHEVVALQHKLREELQSEFPRTVSGRYFVDIDFRPRHEADVIKATTLHFLTYNDDGEIEFVDDLLTGAEVIVGRPHFDDGADSSAWLDRIVQYSVRVEVPDVSVSHDDVIQWERHSTEGERTGRLKVADDVIVTEDIGPITGISEAIEISLSEQIPEHTARSERTDLPLEFVRNATTADWEKLADIRPRNP